MTKLLRSGLKGNTVCVRGASRPSNACDCTPLTPRSKHQRRCIWASGNAQTIATACRCGQTDAYTASPPKHSGYSTRATQPAPSYVLAASELASSSSRAAGIREQARRKIAEAEAAIAAAEASAMRNMKHERFSAQRIPPWLPPEALADVPGKAQAPHAVHYASPHAQRLDPTAHVAPSQNLQQPGRYIGGVESQQRLVPSLQAPPVASTLHGAGCAPLPGALQRIAPPAGSGERPRPAAHPWGRQRELPTFPSVGSGDVPTETVKVCIHAAQCGSLVSAMCMA